MSAPPLCSICIEPLFQEGRQMVSSTICGHAYHTNCLNPWIRQNNTCPTCRELINGQDAVLPLYLDFAPKPCDSVACSQEKADLQKQLEEVTEALAALTLTPAPALDIPYGTHGSRAHLGVFPDSTCLNCESTAHTTRTCPMPPIIQCTGITTFKDWAPSQKFEQLFRIRGEPAGPHVIYFEDNELSAPITHRRQLQMLWSFCFFDDACLICGSPFHHRPD